MKMKQKVFEVNNDFQWKLTRIIAVNMKLISPVELISPYSAQYGVMTIHNKILISFKLFLEKYNS